MPLCCPIISNIWVHAVKIVFCFCFVVTKQKEEGKLQGQLNKSDSNQYIRELKDQIAELNHEVSDKFWSSHISFFLPLYCNNTLLLVMTNSLMMNVFCESLIIILFYKIVFFLTRYFLFQYWGFIFIKPL